MKKIRMALAHPTPLPFPKSEGNDSVFQPLQQDLVVEFAEQFTLLQGKFIFCLSDAELEAQFNKLCYQSQWTKIYCEEQKWKKIIQPNSLFNEIATCEVAVTSCELLIARTGSMVLSSVQQGRIPSVYAPVHVCIAKTSQLVYDIKEGLMALKEKYHQYLPSLITFASGPSRTADIEKTLVVGVHGPKEVYCFLIDDQHHP
ncbi:MAG TPA: LUD domain-containing protein [Flavisolibacter sp.]|nr:LUD domain-containing protein [Flavisolibacter sp.]